jgi:membrane carboxypeptidase/penicillin-binding protein
MKQLQSEAMVLDLEDVTERQLDILLKVEDPAFYAHNGVDLSTPGAGITTITQGLVKKFYFKQFKPGPAKIKQTLIAMFALDPLVSKDDQLRLFINVYHLGNINGQEVQGFEAAAQAFHDKPFQELSEDEYISLVAMIIAPATFHVQRHPERNAERVARIKQVVAGEYTPKGLFDLFYGPMPENVQDNLPPMSYFEKYYQ